MRFVGRLFLSLVTKTILTRLWLKRTLLESRELFVWMMRPLPALEEDSFLILSGVFSLSMWIGMILTRATCGCLLESLCSVIF